MLNRPCIFGKNILCSQYTIELVSWSFTWDWGNRGTRELLHLWPNGSIYISFLVVVQVLWRKILQAHVPTPGIERIELKSKFGALRYSLDPRLIILPRLAPHFCPPLLGAWPSPKTHAQFLRKPYLPTATGLGKESHLMEKMQMAPYSNFQTISLFSALTGVWLIFCVLSIW